MNNNSTTVTNTLANLTKTERIFLEYFYIKSYNSKNIRGVNPFNPALSTLCTRQYINAICKKFGYAGTSQWIVRKQFGRRMSSRGIYDIPELKELHDLWENTDIVLKIVTRAGETIYINRKKNIDVA